MVTMCKNHPHFEIMCLDVSTPIFKVPTGTFSLWYKAEKKTAELGIKRTAVGHLKWRTRSVNEAHYKAVAGCRVHYSSFVVHTVKTYSHKEYTASTEHCGKWQEIDVIWSKCLLRKPAQTAAGTWPAEIFFIGKNSGEARKVKIDWQAALCESLHNILCPCPVIMVAMMRTATCFIMKFEESRTIFILAP